MQYKKISFFMFILIQTLQPSPLAVNYGGSGRTTLTTAFRVLLASTTSTGTLQIVSSTPSNYLILRSLGSGTNPSFTSLGSFMMTFIKTLTASASSSLIFTSSEITNNFANYMIVFNAIVPSTNAVFNMDWSIDGGSTYLNTGFRSGFNSHAYNSTVFTNVNSAITNPLGASNSAAFSGFIFINASATICSGQGMYDTTGQFVEIFGANTSGGVNTIKFSMSAGTMTSGTITLYGLH
jgi:hypothetical protein